MSVRSMYAGQHFRVSIKRRAIRVKMTLYGCMQHKLQYTLYTLCVHTDVIRTLELTCAGC